MKNSILKFIVLSIITTFAFSSCSDYLDKQPDDQLDLESVFENKKNMERWLAYVYRGLPEYYTYDGPDAIADELIPSVGWEAQGFKAIQYQKGNWTADNPGVITYWNTYPKYIRSAYLFIKHAHPLEAVPAEEVDFMKAECRFFIAYYNSMMAIAYGSVPIIREASESTSADDLMLKQEPFYNVIDWADQEMLEASKQLPATQTEDKKYGRVTSVGCLAMRARMLLFAASDLVNGNPALANIKNIDGTPIFNSTHDPERWKRAVDACKLVIDEAEASGYHLHYEYLDNGDIDPFLSYQNAVMKRWNEANRELLFVRTMDSGGWYDKNCIPRGLGINGVGAIGITQSLVDAFFMRNGQRPIIGYNSDGSPKVNPDANYSETGFSTQKETYSTKWQYGSSEGDRNKDENVVVDANTYKMYCDREPRFYISVLHNEQWHIGGKRNTDFYMDGKDGGPSHDANFSGKMPFTYPRLINALATYDFKPCENIGQMGGNYNYDSVMDIQWPFGFGLSYTNYEYSNLKVNKPTFNADDELIFTVDVTNTGKVAGKESVLLFSKDLVASSTPDNIRLRNFEKVSLEPGETKTVTLKLKGSDLAFVGYDGKWRLEKGDFKIKCGDQWMDIVCDQTKVWNTPNKNTLHK